MSTTLSARRRTALATKRKTNNWVGATVIVTDDFGKRHITRAECAPWLLGGHSWVIHLDSVDNKVFRCYDLARVEYVGDYIPPVNHIIPSPFPLQTKKGVVIDDMCGCGRLRSEHADVIVCENFGAFGHGTCGLCPKFTWDHSIPQLHTAEE